jgi:hypothetical protein
VPGRGFARAHRASPRSAWQGPGTPRGSRCRTLWSATACSSCRGRASPGRCTRGSWRGPTTRACSPPPAKACARAPGCGTGPTSRSAGPGCSCVPRRTPRWSAPRATSSSGPCSASKGPGGVGACSRPPARPPQVSPRRRRLQVQAPSVLAGLPQDPTDLARASRPAAGSTAAPRAPQGRAAHPLLPELPALAGGRPRQARAARGLGAGPGRGRGPGARLCGSSPAASC